MKKSDNFNYFIKYIFFISFYSVLIFFDYIYLNIVKRELIEIDNEFNLNTFENETLFLNFKSKIKAIALYFPEFNNISYTKYFYDFQKNKPLNCSNITKLIKAQILLAENHHIYGFAIFFNLLKLD